MMTITLAMPPQFKGKTIGLTGVFDDDQSNDFTSKDGSSQIAVDSTASQVFAWASECKMILYFCCFSHINNIVVDVCCHSSGAHHFTMQFERYM